MNILLIQLKRIGDLILTTPAIAALRDKFPRASISLVVSSAVKELLPAITGIDKVFEVRGKTDVAKWTVEIVDNGLGEAPHQRQTFMLNEFLEKTLIELAQPVAEAAHHSDKQLGRSCKHPPCFVARNAADNRIFLRYHSGRSRF